MKTKKIQSLIQKFKMDTINFPNTLKVTIHFKEIISMIFMKRKTKLTKTHKLLS